MSSDFVIPSQIPWEELKGKNLEECLYWLLDSMGGQDLVWRIGGKGSGSSDQGRDLECTFNTPTPTGDFNRERWWFDPKGRTATVKPSEVKEAVISARGNSDVDVFVVATNTEFSNATRDWVRDWVRSHPRPRILLWARTDLERFCSRYPDVAVRLFSESLSSQGRLELSRTRFWNYTFLSDEPALKQLWKDRRSLAWTSESLLAVIVSECANGDICARPWVTLVAAEDLLETLEIGLLNHLYLTRRATNSGTRQQPLIAALSYLVLACLDGLDHLSVVKAVEDLWQEFDGRVRLREAILYPVLANLMDEIRDVCMDDCTRVVGERVLRDEEVEKYWNRLVEPDPDEKDESKRILIIEDPKKPCKVGFVVNDEIRCPVLHVDHPEKSLSTTLRVLKEIIRKRKPSSRVGV